MPTTEDVQEARRTPTKAHLAIARQVRDGFIRVIFTTNFDRLLEAALQTVNAPIVIRSQDDLLGATPLA